MSCPYCEFNIYSIKDVWLCAYYIKGLQPVSETESDETIQAMIQSGTIYGCGARFTENYMIKSKK